MKKQNEIESGNNEQSSGEDSNIGRRNFIKTAGLASVALGVGLGANSPSAKASATVTDGAPPDDFMKFHEELISIDGASPMLLWGMDTNGVVTDPSGKAFDLYMQGKVTAVAASVSGSRANMDVTKKAVAFFDNVIEKRGFAMIRSVAEGGNWMRVMKQVWGA